MTGQEATNNVEALLQASIHTSPQEAPQQGLRALYPASVQDFCHEAEQPKVEAPSTSEIPFEKAVEAKAEAPTQDSTHQTLQLPLRPKPRHLRRIVRTSRLKQTQRSHRERSSNRLCHPTPKLPHKRHFKPSLKYLQVYLRTRNWSNSRSLPLWILHRNLHRRILRHQ